MALLIGGLVVFFAAHSLSIVAPEVRDRAAARLGAMPWQALYSLVSLVGLVLIIVGYGAARLDPVLLYAPPAWTRHLALALLAPVFVLLAATYLPGRIKRVAKHPTLLAVKLWALAHLLVNGMLADVLLFGSFLAWAVADRISMKRRPSRPLPGAPESAYNDLFALAAGLGLYAGFVLFAHQWLTGVAVLPR